jgi:hypothetical protein
MEVASRGPELPEEADDEFFWRALRHDPEPGALEVAQADSAASFRPAGAPFIAKGWSFQYYGFEEAVEEVEEFLASYKLSEDGDHA